MCEDCAREEIERLEQVLKDISNYVLPVYTFMHEKEPKQYVPFDIANYMRTMAKEALAPPTQEDKK